LVSRVAGDRATPSMATGSPFSKSMVMTVGLVRRVLGRDGAHVDELGGLDRRVFQHLALGRGVQKVGVDAEGRLAALVLGDRDLVLLGEVEQGLAAT
jgi:hypothetical protein